MSVPDIKNLGLPIFFLWGGTLCKYIFIEKTIELGVFEIWHIEICGCVFCVA